MPQIDVLASRQALLRQILRANINDAPAQVQGFVARLFPPEHDRSDSNSERPPDGLGEQLDAMRFHGYPALARTGFAIAQPQATPVDGQLAAKFLSTIDQQRQRPLERQAEFAHDTLALPVPHISFAGLVLS